MKLNYVIMKKIVCIISLIGFLFTKQNAFSQYTNLDAESLAKQYLDLYTTMNFEKIVKYYDETSIFEDRTTSFFNKNNTYETIVGTDNIVEYLVNGFNKISDINFKIENQYTVGIINYSYGMLNYKYDIGRDGNTKKIEFNLPLAIILTIKDNKIVHHQDIADYNVWSKQYRNQTN